MFSFISNFKRYKHVHSLSLMILMGIICAMICNAIIYKISIKNETSILEDVIFDDFFGRKCFPDSYPVVFYGDSRTFNCISPKIVSEILQQPSFNFAFSSGGLNEKMMKFIDSRIDKKNKAVIVLGITPYSLTEDARANESFNEYRDKFRNKGKNMLISPQGPALYDIITMPTKRILSIGATHKGKIFKSKDYIKHYHDDGWVETIVTGDTSKSFKRTLEMYEKRNFQNNPISKFSIDETLTYIRKWTEEGIIVLVFRPPTCEEMEEIEERKTKFSSFRLEDKVRENGGIYVNIPRSGWFSYDASHLDADSAKRLSEFIGNVILQHCCPVKISEK